MKLDQEGLLIVLSGPSGVGKGTVRKALFEHTEHNIEYSISMTTRSPREGEVNGKDYFFVSKEEFEEEIKQGNLLEYATYVNNYYGTPLKWIKERIAKGSEVMLEIEVNGALQVKEKMPNAVFIFLAPPTIDALFSRLKHRGTDTDEVIKGRIDKAKWEISLASKYDYIVVNDEIENAVDKILAIIRAEHAKCDRTLDSYLKHLNLKGEENDRS